MLPIMTATRPSLGASSRLRVKVISSVGRIDALSVKLAATTGSASEIPAVFAKFTPLLTTISRVITLARRALRALDVMIVRLSMALLFAGAFLIVPAVVQSICRRFRESITDIDPYRERRILEEVGITRINKATRLLRCGKSDHPNRAACSLKCKILCRPRMERASGGRLVLQDDTVRAKF